MTSPREGFLADVIENPEDDTPRLVFADWLDDNGEPERAEAIRLAVRRRGLDDLDPEAWVLDARLSRLQQKYEEVWSAGLPKLEHVQFRLAEDGFVVGAYAYGPETLRRHEDTIFSAGPITDLEVIVYAASGRAPIWEAPKLIAGCPYLSRVRTLHIGGMVPPEVVGLPLLTECSALVNLRGLVLQSSYHQSSLLQSMASCRPLPRLESLDVSGNWFGPVGWRALASAPLLATLRTLDVSNSNLRNAGLDELVRSPHLCGLRAFRARENSLTTQALRRFAAADWPSLDVLDLSGNELGPRAANLFVAWPVLSRLRSFDLSANHSLGIEGLKGLLRCPLDRLRVLDISFCGLEAFGPSYLARAPWLCNLTKLDLTGNDSTRLEIEALAAAPLTGLRWLTLWYADLTDEHVRKLLAAPWIDQLTHLELAHNAIGAGGARALAEAPGLDNLVDLDLCDNRIPPAAAEGLVRRFGDRVELKRPWDDD